MKKWDIKRTEYQISDFLGWQKSGQLELSPSFQRRPVWQPSAKSFLMDTIIRGLPIPIIFVREQINLQTMETNRQVVDGQQRIRTVLSYIAPSSLKDYDKVSDYFQIKKIHNPGLAGKTFEELPYKTKEDILQYSFSTHILPPDVDDKQVLQIFARLNATGVKLNAQELRNAQYFSEFKETIYLLGYEQLERWRSWGIFSENNIARMDEAEFVTDLIAFILKGIIAKDKTTLDKLYEEYENKDFRYNRIVIDRFREVMDSIDELIGKDLANTEFSLKTLFYYVFALTYDFHYSVGSSLEKVSKKPLPRGYAGKILDINRKIASQRGKVKIWDLAIRRSSKEVRKEIFVMLKKRIVNG